MSDADDFEDASLVDSLGGDEFFHVVQVAGETFEEPLGVVLVQLVLALLALAQPVQQREGKAFRSFCRLVRTEDETVLNRVRIQSSGMKLPSQSHLDRLILDCSYDS